MAQEIINIGTVPNDHTGDPLRTAFDKSNDNFTELYARPVGGYKFNVLEAPYNVDNTGSASASSGIQAAVDAASAEATAVGLHNTGRTVYIPEGTYLITTAINLRSEITIRCEPSAAFRFPVNYAGYMWQSVNQKLRNCWVIGGTYYITSYLHTIINLVSDDTAHYIMGNHFKDLYIERCYAGIRQECTGTGWQTANVFEDIFIFGSIIQIEFVGDACSGNFYSNLNFQPLATSTYGIKDIAGSSNYFQGILWDVAVTPGGFISCSLAATSINNTINIEGITEKNFSDLGVGNIVRDGGSWQNIAARYFKLWAEHMYDTVIDKLTIGHYGDSGTTAAPAGDVALKLKSRMIDRTDDLGSNYSARILIRNSAGSNRGSFIYLQTHKTANDDTVAGYVDALRAEPSGNLYSGGAINYVVDNSVGGNDTYTATELGFLFVTGKIIIFHPLTANTGACTLNINAGGAIAIKTQDNADPANNTLRSTGYYQLCWNGANWVIISNTV